MKVQVYNNKVKLELQSKFDSAVAYYKKHNVDLQFVFQDVFVSGYEVYTDYYNRILIEGADRLVPQDDADITMFVFDGQEFQAPQIPTSNCYVIYNKPFINLETDLYDDSIGNTYVGIVHELMHALVRILWQKGIMVQDVMDTYRENYNPDSPTGNFSEQWAILAPFYKPQVPFVFTRDLKMGDTGEDVRQLQIALNNLGFPIASSGVGSPGKESNFFGVLTQQALSKYQVAKIISPSSGYFGPITRKSLNDNSNMIDNKFNKISIWADAIQQFEGWYPGSRSFRNNNPGNIKYIGQKTAEGADNGGFCVFADYQAGRSELVNLLINACTGKSTVYHPTMTITQFYEHYAPSTDNNYPDKYAAFVAGKMGVSASVEIGTLVG